MPDAATLSVQVDPAIFARFPDYVTAVVRADGLIGGPSDDVSEGLLVEAENGLRARGLERAADHPNVRAWREAFSAFGAKPSRYPSSAESLAARVLKGQPLPRINRLVDLYNAVSVRHLLPVGGEDAASVAGTLRLVVADGTEPFAPWGDGAGLERAAPGEVVWRDDDGVTCRRWNWRQGPRTQLTERTRSAFFILDRLPPVALPDLEVAASELVADLRTASPGAVISVATLSADGVGA